MAAANMLVELKLNLLGKVMFAAVGSWLVGRPTNMKIRGTVEEVTAFRSALLASRNFQAELERSGATVESVMQCLGLKHGAAREFERIMGVPWPM
jgi:hypothetical protein